MNLDPCLPAGSPAAAWTALAATAAVAVGIGRQAGTIVHRLTSDRAEPDPNPDIAHARLAVLAAVAVTGALFKAAGCSMHDAYAYAAGGSIGAISTYSLAILWVRHAVKRDA